MPASGGSLSTAEPPGTFSGTPARSYAVVGVAASSSLTRSLALTLLVR